MMLQATYIIIAHHSGSVKCFFAFSCNFNIRKNYGIMVQDLLYSYEKEQDKKAILLVIGIALLILYYTGFSSILKEVILMMGWISICGSVYGLIFSSTQSYVKINRLKNLSKARIYFN